MAHWKWKQCEVSVLRIFGGSNFVLSTAATKDELWQNQAVKRKTNQFKSFGPTTRTWNIVHFHIQIMCVCALYMRLKSFVRPLPYALFYGNRDKKKAGQQTFINAAYRLSDFSCADKINVGNVKVAIIGLSIPNALWPLGSGISLTLNFFGNIISTLALCVAFCGCPPGSFSEMATWIG